MYAQERRRLRRAEKRIEWLKQNNKTFAISAKASTRNTLTLKRKPKYVPKSLLSIFKSARRKVKEYKNHLLRAAHLFNFEFKRKPVETGSVCLPEVAIYAAGFRSIKRGAVHIMS